MRHRLSLLTLFLYAVLANFSIAIAQTNIPGLQKPDSSLHLIVMGDWGRNGAPGQQKVADVMGLAGAQLDISFVITTGDNIYPSGVTSVTDSQWISSFENVYRAPSLQVKWYPVLGNHDYILNPDAEIAYTKYSTRWYMPARYYDTSYAIGKDSILFVFMDTDPIEKEFRHIPYDSMKYRPEDVTRQLNWLEQVLSSSHAQWKIVVGHNPLHTGGARRHNSRTRKMRKILQPLFHRYQVNLYMCGHDHHLEYLKPKGPTYYLISGAGSENTHVGWLKWHRRFAARKRGFATLSISQQKILVQFISDRKKLLYSTTIVK